MTDLIQTRVALRRDTHDLNDGLDHLLDRLDDFTGEEFGALAADCIKRARIALFEAWTILCNPPEEDEDD